jgi:hypothetical protein
LGNLAPALHVNEKKILLKAVDLAADYSIGGSLLLFYSLVFALGATVQFSQWLGFGAMNGARMLILAL